MMGQRRPNRGGWNAYLGASGDHPMRIYHEFRGKSAIYIMVDENGNSALSEKAAKVCVDSFLRRPSVKPVALETICGFVNDAVLSGRGPSPQFTFAASIFMIHGTNMAWAISGNSAVMLFSDGKLERYAVGEPYPCFGSSPTYKPDIQQAFQPVRGEKALFLCSGRLLKTIRTGSVEKALQQSNGPKDWNERVKALSPSTQFNSLAAWIPSPSRGMMEALMNH